MTRASKTIIQGTVSGAIKRNSLDSYVSFREFRFSSSDFLLPRNTVASGERKKVLTSIEEEQITEEVISDSFRPEVKAREERESEKSPMIRTRTDRTENDQYSPAIFSNGPSCRTSRAHTPRMPPSVFTTPLDSNQTDRQTNAGNTPSCRRTLSSSRREDLENSPPPMPDFQQSRSPVPTTTRTESIQDAETTIQTDQRSHPLGDRRSSELTVPELTSTTTSTVEAITVTQTSVGPVDNSLADTAADSQNPGTLYQPHVEEYLPTTYLAPAINGEPRFPQACVLHTSANNLWGSKSKLLQDLKTRKLL